MLNVLHVHTTRSQKKLAKLFTAHKERKKRKPQDDNSRLHQDDDDDDDKGHVVRRQPLLTGVGKRVGAGAGDYCKEGEDGLDASQPPKSCHRARLATTLDSRAFRKVVAKSTGKAALRLVPGESQSTIVKFAKGPNVNVSQDKHNACVNFTSNEDVLSTEFIIPYRSDVELVSQAGSLEITDYLEGDLTAHGHTGIRLGKVRGNKVDLTSQGDIKVSKDLEAVDMTIACASFSTRKLLAQSARLESTSGNMDIQAAYVDEATITAQNGGTLAVNGFHGRLVVRGSANVKLLGVSGSVDLEIERGNVEVQFDSLSETTPCRLLTKDGAIQVTLPMDQEILVDAAAKHPIEKCPEGLVASADEPNVVRGTFAGAPEPNRATHRASMTGKVNLEATKTRQATWSGATTNQSDDGEGDAVVASGGEALQTLARLSIQAPQGSVSLEAVSWIDRIRNRFLPSSEP
ncbi:Hypothetical Protein FCC1311_028322 [Hondaea fermentalgiana]|uniref:DUF4097 domain-containing protein n=1 Tax=Hondaea fermentalgiana TaxID=2315210 RepID=A0A2R5GEG5_9STRA|nr:Hypothetical Protein FCC1311_028322 [Hondaea fermentalgiana]|eukprot:GBG26611.1 Hypothetical Protein FCC1311_028322 [Hondaea fermentalgiana]